uniref:DUF4817 domain-containing protein n=1 Tax=Anoplophora glabripennis TaxID=217634 RepID=V5IAH9_ANOGL
MKVYSTTEIVDMMSTIGECYENCFLASRVYAQKYPDRIHPNKKVFERLLARFRATGGTAYNKQRKPKRVTDNEENEFMVLGLVVENPNTSTRKIAREADISRTSVRRILKKHSTIPSTSSFTKICMSRIFNDGLTSAYGL